jgi:hypothetical protein
MRKLIILLLAVILTGSIVLSGCSTTANVPNQNGKNSEGGSTNKTPGIPSETANSSTVSLSSGDANGLLFTVEEEKLAHDVYVYLYDKWHVNVFLNIISAEQTHMDSVRSLIEKYGLTDPTKDEALGVFQNSDIQALYDSLTAQGSSSAKDALVVGANIEEIDIVDIEDKMKYTSNKDINNVYTNLISGSESHLRAFVSNLENYGIDYNPSYLTQTEFDSIINSDSNGKGGN